MNNAGIQHVAPIENFPPEKWDAIIAINLSATFHTIHARAAADEGGKGWGRIINIASTHGLVASAHKVAYVAAKHGIDRPHQGGRHRMRRHRRHLQRDLPRLGADAAGAGADRGAREGRQSISVEQASRTC